MNEKCERLRDEAALLGKAPEELKEHASSCSECTEFLSRLAALADGLAALRARDASDELVAKTLARPELGHRPSIRFRGWAVALASAASLVLLFRIGMEARKPAFELERDDPSVGVTTGPTSSGGAGGGGGAGSASELPASPELTEEMRRQLDSLGYIGADRDVLAPEEQKAKLERSDDFKEREELYGQGKKDADGAFGRVGEGTLLLDDKNQPAKRLHRDPLYPELAKGARVQGTVVLELTVDREGNVTEVRVVESTPPFDQAAIDAVREWKYVPSDSEAPRIFRVFVPFALEEPEDDEDRSRLDGLAFQEAKGYWANTYVPGDPMLRSLELALRETSYPPLHLAAHPATLPLDATSTGALSLFLHADRRGLSSKSRLLVQVGIRALDHHGRRRPPMNVGVVLHLPESITTELASATTALLESLESSREAGDRFRLIATGSGEVLTPETFRQGPLTVALQDLYARTPSGSLSEALALALQKVHADDDPTMPLGTSVVLVVTGRTLGRELRSMARMAQASAVGGVSVSAIGLGEEFDSGELDRLALEGQGRRYLLESSSEGPAIIDRELSSASRTVARAIRLRIQLTEGVQLVDVLGSKPLSARESERVRAEERSIDLRLARNLGIEADRGKDEDGIQIVIPAFYAGDAHSILLDVVAEGPGPIAEVTARYKDLVRLENTVARASLALPRRESASGPLETSVGNDYRELRVAEALRSAAEAMERGEIGTASQTLQRAMAFAREKDRSMLSEYLRFFPQLPTSYLRDSLLYASALKRSHSASPIG